jgi:predicted lipid-binding transport protein (Tim44 family)
MMANVIVIALLAMVGIWLIRKFMNRRRPHEPAYSAGGSASSAGGYAQGSSFQQGSGGTTRAAAAAMRTKRKACSAAVQRPRARQARSAAPLQVPAGFDTEAFLRSAKVYFVRLQAAWDQGNMADIREFTTPEMFAEIKIDLDSRGNEANQTDVVQLDAELVAIEDRGIEQSASVRFRADPRIGERVGGTVRRGVEPVEVGRSGLAARGHPTAEHTERSRRPARSLLCGRLPPARAVERSLPTIRRYNRNPRGRRPARVFFPSR